MKRYGRCLYDWVISFPLSYALVLFFRYELGIPDAGFGICLYTALYCVAFAVLRFLKGRDRLLLAGAIAVFLGLPALFGPLSGGAEYFFSHREIWLIPAIAAGSHLAAVLCERSRLARYALALSVIACLVIAVVFDYDITKLCVMTFLSVLMLLFADETQLLWRKSGHTDHTLHLPFVAPFVFLWLLFCLLFPVGEKPYEWRVFRALWGHIQNLTTSLTGRGGADDFDSYIPGFSEGARLSGSKIDDDDTIVMYLTPLSGNSPSVRLAGQYCDTFADMKWESTVKTAFEAEFDSLETRCAFSGFSNFTDYLRPIDLQVTYRTFSSRHLFTPDKMLVTGSTLRDLSVKETGRNLLYDKKRGENNSYKVSGYSVNLKNSVFADFMNRLTPISEADWNALSLRADMSAYTRSYSHFLQYREQLKRDYGKAVTLNRYTKEWVNQVTDGAETDFDRILRIAQALNSFTYTKDPGRFPDSVTDAASFLDYFLSKREGYCTHFATAMTLLARAEGLPARYVHGFSVTLDGKNTVSVTGDMAHAWCEIYFENAGWIPFDVTPGYSADSYWPLNEDDVVPTAEPTPSLTPAPQPESRKRIPFGQILVVTLLALAALLAFAAAVLLSDRLITKALYKKLPAAEKIRVLYRRNTRILSYLGHTQEESETLAEFHTKLLAALPAGASDWIPAYERYLYGADADPAAVVPVMEQGADSLISSFKAQRPRLYLLCRLGNRLIH
ncbi:MAG: transglutaminase domain-containing protein [Lachnospiraceae bacterium]|nr:transglutaminase domain-containing protein [Lachnospiraceae bacterium]